MDDEKLKERLLMKRPGFALSPYGHCNPDGPEALARIEALEQALSEARAAERERCAKVAEKSQCIDHHEAFRVAKYIAQAIRGLTDGD